MIVGESGGCYLRNGRYVKLCLSKARKRVNVAFSVAGGYRGAACLTRVDAGWPFWELLWPDSYLFSWTVIIFLCECYSLVVGEKDGNIVWV